MKNISVLGISGSIGSSFLKVYSNFSEELNLLGISSHTNIEKTLDIINKYNPEYAVITDRDAMYKYFQCYETKYNNTIIYSGEEGLDFIYNDKKNDIILNGISGKAGLIPSIKIVQNGINIALANKESIVCAGPILKELAKKNNCSILPVDSEHSAIFHLLKKEEIGYLKNIYLTASGGPFLNRDKKYWNNITISEALNHPTWKMGNKISIDSATMANKGLEVIEAHQLFNISYDHIKVLIHPQSIIHSMIETIDGEIYAQIGPNDMSIPIQNAIFFPELKHNNYNNFDFSKAIKFELLPVDFNKYKMLDFAYYCGKKGIFYTAFYNFINELLVNKFLNSQISFLDIEIGMEKSLNYFESQNLRDLTINLENIFEIEKISNQIIKMVF